MILIQVLQSIHALVLPAGDNILRTVVNWVNHLRQ
jgi:hypothetical protein